MVRDIALADFTEILVGMQPGPEPWTIQEGEIIQGIVMRNTAMIGEYGGFHYITVLDNDDMTDKLIDTLESIQEELDWAFAEAGDRISILCKGNDEYEIYRNWS